MKKYKTTSNFLLLIYLITFSTLANAHCPAHEKSEKVCFMLDENKVFVWDDKVEHSGPYKDTKNILKFSNEKGNSLLSKKIARGIYQIESATNLKTIFVEGSEKSFQKIQVKAER